MSSQHQVALLWLRRDLRLHDNPALTHALQAAVQVIPLYIHAPEEEAPWTPGAASRCWLHRSLEQLQAQLAEHGSRLIIRYGPGLETLRTVIDATGATLVCWNRVYEPACIARDTHIEQTLRAHGIATSSHNAALLFEPWEILNQQGQAFRVFTPFWRACQKQLAIHPPVPLPAPKTLPPVMPALVGEPLTSLQLLPTVRWDDGIAAQWRPGEQHALAQLETFAAERLQHYAARRDVPSGEYTSALSPYLHFGEIGPRQIIAALTTHEANARNDSYVRELGWREFAHHLLYHFPNTPLQPLDARFARFPWQDHPAALTAWQRGMTGIPLVDAGMRELWRTGWMHNRVRMIVASFLTKNLRLHWLAGARWFWDTLVDADLANNTLGWQWTAGCGADAAPFFRIFNPVLQGQRFDAHGEYVRRWIPELARLPTRWIHQPWQAPAAELAAANITLGVTYPEPIVDLSLSRERALEAYAAIKQRS